MHVSNESTTRHLATALARIGFLFLLLLCSLFLIGASASPARADEIAYVVGNPANLSAHEQAVISMLQNEMPHHVTVYPDNSLALGAYDMLLIADSANNSLIAQLPVNSGKTMIMNGKYLEQWGWELNNPYPAHYIGQYYETNINKFIDGYHEITDPFWIAGPIYVTVTNTRVHQIVISQQLGRKLLRGDSGDNAVISVMDNPRRGFFGIQGANYYSPEGKSLFKRTVTWILYNATTNPPVLDPVANVTGYEEQLVRINATGRDYDNDPLTFSYSSPFTSQGTWQTHKGDAGVYEVNVTVSDGRLTDMQTITVTILPIDADGDGYNITGGAQFGPVDCNDNDPSVHPNAVEILGQGFDLNCVAEPPVFISTPSTYLLYGNSYGYVAQAQDYDGYAITYGVGTVSPGLTIDPQFGVVSWTPNQGQLGQNTITIRAISFAGATNQTFTVFVNAAPQLAQPIPDQTWPMDTNHQMNLNTYFTDANGQQLTYTCTQPTNIQAIVSGSTLTLTPLPGWFGSASMQCSASDGNESVEGNVFGMTVNHVNHPPVITSAPITTGAQGSLYSYAVQASDPDQDGLSYALLQSPPRMNISQQGIISWVPGNDEVGVWTIALQVTDGQFAVTQQYTLTIANVNDAPGWNPIPAQSWPQDTSYLLNLSPYAYDIDGDMLSFTIPAIPNIQTTVNGNAIIFNPDANFVGTRQVRITASDGALQTQSGLFNLIVTRVNRKPTIISTPITQANERSLYSYQVAATDPNGDPLQYLIIQGAPNMSINSNTGLLEWTPGRNQIGTWPITVQATDGGLNDNQSYMLTVSYVNQNPLFVSPIPDQAWDQDTNATINLSQHFQDPDGDLLVFNATGIPNVTVLIDPLTGIATLVPDPWFTGNRSVVFSASDGNASIDSNIVSLSVGRVNHLPIVQPITTTSFTEGDLVLIIVNATDPDGDPLTITYSPPVNASGEWQTNYTSAGAYPMQVNVSDGLLTVQQNFTLTIVESGNHAPLLTIMSGITVTEGETADALGSFIATDPDGDAVVISYGAPLNASGQWLTNFTNAGNYSVMITASDGSMNTSRNTTIFVLESGNHPPVFTTIPPQSWNQNTNITINLCLYAYDPDGDALSFGMTPANNVTSLASGCNITLVPAWDFSGFISVNFTASDGNATGMSNPVVLTVVGPGTCIPNWTRVYSNLGVAANITGGETQQIVFDGQSHNVSIMGVNSDQQTATIVVDTIPGQAHVGTAVFINGHRVFMDAITFNDPPVPTIITTVSMHLGSDSIPGACNLNDTRTVLYYDNNVCNNTINLPADNGTIESCDYCTPNWQQQMTFCIENSQTLYYTDSNTCFAITNLTSDNNAPANQTVACNSSCVPNWQQDFNNTGACRINDTRLVVFNDVNSCNTTWMLPPTNGTSQTCDYCLPQWAGNTTMCSAMGFQNTTYHDVFACFAQTNLSSDFLGKPADIFNQACIPGCVPDWRQRMTGLGECKINDTRLVIYDDVNHCNSTYQRPADHGTRQPCDFCSPQWQTNLTNCTSMGFQNLTYYDTKGCFALTNLTSDNNHPAFQYNLACTPSCVPSWQQDMNGTGACQANDSRLVVYNDINHCNSSYQLPSINGSSQPCDYCSPNWVSNLSACTIMGFQNLTFVDTKACFAQTNLTSDNNHPAFQYNLACIPGCVPDWRQVTTGIGACALDDSRLVVFEDLNACNSSYQLPASNGTRQSCDYCTPSYVLNTTACMNTDTRTVYFSDVNGCFAQTGLASDNIAPPNVTQSCDYCVPEWTAQQIYYNATTNATCFPDDTRRTTYVDNRSCFAQTGLASDIAGKPADFVVTCDFCTPQWTASNTTCRSNDTLVQYYNDLNSCFAITGNAADAIGPANSTLACNYQIPALVMSIPNQTWYQDTVQVLNLSRYFNDTSALAYTSTDPFNVNVSINGSMVRLIPRAHWNGHDNVTFAASDGFTTVTSNLVGLHVLPVNHAPTIGPIRDIYVTEGEIVQVTPVVSDPDGDNLSLTYSTPLNATGGWQTTNGTAGVYITVIWVTDGQYTAATTFMIRVLSASGVCGNGVLEASEMCDGSVFRGLTCADYGFTNGTLLCLNNCQVSTAICYNSNNSNTTNQTNATYCFDNDLDGFNVTVGNGSISCGPVDCNDLNATIHPGAPETLGQGYDSNCAYEPPIVSANSPIMVQAGNVAQAIVTVQSYDYSQFLVLHGLPLNSTGGWLTTLADVGTHQSTLTVSDGVTMAQQNITIIVYNGTLPNSPPTLAVQSPITVYEGQIAQVHATATDPDGDPTTISYPLPFNTSGAWLTHAGDAGTYNYLVRATDGRHNVTAPLVVIVLQNSTQPISHAPWLDAEDLTVYEGDQAKLVLHYGDSDGDPVSFTYTDPFDSKGEWQTKIGDAGDYLVNVTAFDGTYRVTDTAKVTVLKAEFQKLEIGRIIVPETEPGQTPRISVEIINRGTANLKNLQATAVIPELALRATSGFFTLNRGKEKVLLIPMEIPDDVKPGTYDLRITISNDDNVRRVKYRDLYIN